MSRWPSSEWRTRNATDAEGEFLRGERHLLMDRDTKLSEAFRTLLEQAGVEGVQLRSCSPNLNPDPERFVGSIEAACLERMILFGESALHSATAGLHHETAWLPAAVTARPGQHPNRLPKAVARPRGCQLLTVGFQQRENVIPHVSNAESPLLLFGRGKVR